MFLAQTIVQGLDPHMNSQKSSNMSHYRQDSTSLNTVHYDYDMLHLLTSFYPWEEFKKIFVNNTSVLFLIVSCIANKKACDILTTFI